MVKGTGYKALCAAVAGGNGDMLRQAVAADSAAARHWKPVMDAAFAGRADMIEALLDAGADPNAVAGSSSRHTPLVRAIQPHASIPKHAGHGAAVDLLLARGADPDLAAGPHGMPPLAYAALGGFQGFLTKLLDAGAAVDIYGAAMLYDLEALQGEIARVGVDCPDGRGRTALHYLAWSGMWKLPHIGSAPALDCLNLLIEAGADVNLHETIVDGDEFFQATALWRATAWQKHTVLVYALLEAGAQPAQTVFGAAYAGDEEILAALDAFGADWNLRFNGRTPLLDLLHFRKPGAVPWLLRHGADSCARDQEGRTALHLGALQGVRVAYLEALVAHGADPRQRDNTGQTALDLARRKRHGRTIAWLEGL